MGEYFLNRVAVQSFTLSQANWISAKQDHPLEMRKSRRRYFPDSEVDYCTRDDGEVTINSKTVQYLLILMNTVTCKHEKSKITLFIGFLKDRPSEVQCFGKR